MIIIRFLSIALAVSLITACSGPAVSPTAEVTRPFEARSTQTDLPDNPPQTSTPGVTAPALTDTPQIAQTAPTLTDTPQIAQTAPALTDTPQVAQTAPALTDTPQIIQTTPALTDTPQIVLTPTTLPDQAGLESKRVDHTSLALFDQIPDEYLAAARALRMVYVDASVGQNINEGMDCLTAPSWGQAPASCRRDYEGQIGGTWKSFSANDLQSGSVPERIQFDPDPVRYDRSNWDFVAMPASWDTILQGFVQDIVPEWIDQKDVLSYQFNYLHVAPDSPIADPVEGFFVDQPHQGFYPNRERWDISDLEALEAQYPDKVFIYWTTSLSRAIGSDVSNQFNDQMRAYAAANEKYLFDVADILSHDGQDQACYDNRDGVEYCGPNGCENYPDDGQNNPAICQDYTTETEGGHLGSVSAGKIRLAKGFWVLMALIAGWQP